MTNHLSTTPPPINSFASTDPCFDDQSIKSINSCLPSQTHAVIILASGLSQRLGTPKQLLTQQGDTLVSLAIKLALVTCPQAIIVVTSHNQREVNTVVKALVKQHSFLHSVSNTTPEIGMGQSLWLGIEALHQLQNLTVKQVLIMAVDQVLLDTAHLEKLLYPFKNNTTDKKVIASQYSCNTENALSKHIIGLPVVINYELLQQWQLHLSGDKGLRHLIRALSQDQISQVKNDKLSFDIDTPRQLAFAQEQGWIDR